MAIPQVTCDPDIVDVYSSLPRLTTLGAVATGAPSSWRWDMLSVPVGSSANVGINGDFVNGVAVVQNPSFTADVDGSYVCQCVATNFDGPSDPTIDQENGQQITVIKTSVLDLEIPGDLQHDWDLYMNRTLKKLETQATAHAADHQSGGSDPIKLDDLASPDDNTDLNASTSAHGLMAKLSNVGDQAYVGTGSWQRIALATVLGYYAAADEVNIPVNVNVAALDPNQDVMRVWWLDNGGVPHQLVGFRERTMSWGTTGRAEFLGDEVDSATAIGIILGSDVAYTTVGAVLAAIRNAGATKWQVDFEGAVKSAISEHGGNRLISPIRELVTVAAAASTDSSAFIPAGCRGVVTATVVTAIPGVATWSLGDSVSATRWGTSLLPTVGGNNQSVALTNGWVFFAADTPIRITPNTTPSAATGQVRIYGLYEKVTAPTS